MKKKAPYTKFGKTVMLPVEVWLNGKIIDTDVWDEEWFIEREEDIYGMNSQSLRNRKIRIVMGEDFREETNLLRYVNE